MSVAPGSGGGGEPRDPDRRRGREGRALPRLLERLIAAHPPAYVERYGDALRDALELRLEASVSGRVRLRTLLREAAGLARSAVREWREERRGRKEHWRGGGPPLSAEFGAGARRLLRTPGFTLATVAMLALGLGATAAVYTLVHRILLRPLPYEAADRLVWLDHSAPGLGLDRGIGTTVWLALRYAEASRQLEDLAIARMTGTTLTSAAGDAERVSRADVSPGMGRLLGRTPRLGRWFGPSERGVVVLSDGLWQRRWGGDPAVIGRHITLEGVEHEIIGVMPPGFAVPSPTVDVWVGFDYGPDYADQGFNAVAVGRLAPGATLEGLREELATLVAGSPAALGGNAAVTYLVEEGRIQPRPVALIDHVTADVRASLWLLLAAVGLVLLTAWANVANLFLVRTDARRREVAVRRALGANRSSLARFFLAEGMLLSLTGWIAGLALAWIAVRVAVVRTPVELPRSAEIALDARVVLTSLALALLAGLGLTLIPLLQRQESPAPVLRDGGRGMTAGAARLRLRTLLLGIQVALALALLASAGLLVRSHAAIRAASPGFAARDVLLFDVGLPVTAYRSRAEADAFWAGVRERIAALPGVRAVAVASCPPLRGFCWGESARRADAPSATPDGNLTMQMKRVSAEFFDVLQLPLVFGRAFDATGDVAVLSVEAARRIFGTDDPIGRRIVPGWDADEGPRAGGGVDRGRRPGYTVVGVVADAATTRVTEASPDPVVYLPLRDAGDGGVSIHDMTVLVRTDGDPAALVPAVRSMVAELDPRLPLSRVRTLEEMLAADRAPVTFATVLLSTAGIVALLLGALGIHAVFSWVVGRRTSEIAVRRALGASARDILAILFRQTVPAALIGLVAGTVAAIALGRVFASLLYRVDPLDAGVLAGSAAVLLLIAVAAAAGPARRAWKLRPIDALRAE